MTSLCNQIADWRRMYHFNHDFEVLLVNGQKWVDRIRCIQKCYIWTICIAVPRLEVSITSREINKHRAPQTTTGLD